MFFVKFICFTSVIRVGLSESIIAGLQKFTPPSPKYGAPPIYIQCNRIFKIFSIFYYLLKISTVPSVFHPDNFEWEKSGLFEGDIALHEPERNVLLSNSSRWENATIPFHIEDSHFTDDEIKVILLAIKEFHTKTCLRLKPYEPSDENWVSITGRDRGCFSYVGMKHEGGQQLNLFSPNCVKKGIVQHELLHAAGFYHQQSASDRDEYVEILWENIESIHAGNFNKYNKSVVTDYGIGYDYDSIMHYSGKAFSKNGNATIVAKQNVTRLGQRDGFTEKDILKLNRMYEDSCHATEIGNQVDAESDSDHDIINWFQSLFKN